MIKALREIDDIYFGCTRRGIAPSATNTACALLTGFMPWRFAWNRRTAAMRESDLAAIARRQQRLA